MRFLLALTIVAGCRSSAAPTPPEAGLPAVSLQRFERIVRACGPGGGVDYSTIRAEQRDGAWRIQVTGGAPERVVDPVASTCDGKLIASTPEPGDVDLSAVVALAMRCDGGSLDSVVETEIDYYRDATAGGRVDRARFDVSLQRAGAPTGPQPHFLVDSAAGTCTTITDRP